jgi:hypothetical protein
VRAKPGRPKSAAPKQKHVTVRLSENALRQLDNARGALPRSAFLRTLLREHIEKGQK